MRPSHGISVATAQLRESGTAEETGHRASHPFLVMPCCSSPHLVHVQELTRVFLCCHASASRSHSLGNKPAMVLS